MHRLFRLNKKSTEYKKYKIKLKKEKKRKLNKKSYL